MIVTFVALLISKKLPSGIALMAAAVVGLLAAVLGSGIKPDIRYLVEGTFGYFDTIMVILSAMVFMAAVERFGTLEYISVLLVKAFRRVPGLLLISLMLIIMFPAMVTGSSLASAITTGALVAPIMVKWGIPKEKVGAIVATGSILGMVAPPVNVPAMVICDVVDIPFVDFTLPLLMLSIPMAIVCVLLLGRRYVRPIAREELDQVVDTAVLKELHWTAVLPMVVLVALIVLELIFPKLFGSFGMVLMFVTATLVSFITGRRVPLFKKPDGSLSSWLLSEPRPDEKPQSILAVIASGVHRALPAMGLLMGVGMFMEVLTLVGVRGYFATNVVAMAMSLPKPWGSLVGYLMMALSLPLFGGISAFGSASILGGPFVMMLNGIGDNVIVTCGLSLLAAVGEFSPPTAMSATFGAEISGTKKWSLVTRAAWPAILTVFLYSMLYVTVFANRIYQDSGTATLTTLFWVTLGAALAVAVIWEVLALLLMKKPARINKEEDK